MSSQFNWNAFAHTVIGGLSIAAVLGWISTRDAARDAYRIANEADARITVLEHKWYEASVDTGSLHAEIPSLRRDVDEIRRKQDWMSGVLYDLARAWNPKLPIDPPPTLRPQGG